jgi:hypothetical protein
MGRSRYCSSPFFHRTTSPDPIRCLERISNLLNICGVICICNRLPGVFITGVSRLPVVFSTGESTKIGYLLVPNFPESQAQKVETLLCVHHRGVETPWCIHYRRVEITCCMHHLRVETSQCIHHWGVVLDTGELYPIRG